MTVSVVFISLVLISCSMGYEGAVAAPEYDYQESEDSSRTVGMASKSAVSDAYEAEPVMFDDGNGASEAKPTSERKRVYNGSAGIVVDNIDDTRYFLEELANNSGGYVESSFSDYVVLRVPAEMFSEIFEQVLSAGKLEYSRVETLDVTEAFSDIERLLNTARETRERLYILLERSSDAEERARILREIGRLTEEISSLEQQLKLLESRISLSRISIQLIPRSPMNTSREDIPFSWIASLDPLVPAGFGMRAKVKLDLGSEWAVFSKDTIYMAENGNRDHLSISTIKNAPHGDGVFWSQALMHHLSPYYAAVEELEIEFGSRTVRGVELVSKDRTPFRYFVGVVPDGRFLHVIEIFSPDSAGGFDSLYQAMKEGELK